MLEVQGQLLGQFVVQRALAVSVDTGLKHVLHRQRTHQLVIRQAWREVHMETGEISDTVLDLSTHIYEIIIMRCLVLYTTSSRFTL